MRKTVTVLYLFNSEQYMRRTNNIYWIRDKRYFVGPVVLSKTRVIGAYLRSIPDMERQYYFFLRDESQFYAMHLGLNDVLVEDIHTVCV